MQVSRFAYIGIVVAALALATVLCGCHAGDVGGDDDGGDDGGGGGRAAIPLGNMRVLQVGDTWTFGVTGTFAPDGGGIQNVNPVDAIVTYRAAPGATGIAGTNEFHIAVDIAYGGVDDTHEDTFAVTQDGDGRLNLFGYAPMIADQVDPLQGGGSVAGPDPAAFGATNSWNFDTQLASYGQFAVDAAKQGVVNVTVPAGTFEAYRFTGTRNFGGWVTNFEVWINPQTGMWVKMITTIPEFSGTLTLTYELKNTSFAIQ